MIDRPALGALLILLVAGPLSAQPRLEPETLALGQGLCRVLRCPEGLLLQGDGLVSLIEMGAEPRVLGEAALPDGVFVYTLAGVPGARLLEFQDAEGIGTVAFRPPGEPPAAVSRLAVPSLFRGRASAPAEYRDFRRETEAGPLRVRPLLEGLAVSGAAAGAAFVVPAALASEQSLGWGLGYEMSARLVTPFFAFAETDGRAGIDLLYRDGAHFMTRALGPEAAEAKNRAWGRAPASESTEVVRFDQRVPPLVADCDGDGLDDMVHVDPGGGYVFVYRGKGRDAGREREPDQIFNVGGHALWRYLADVDGDGRQDLLVLTMARMNVIAQVNVMREESLPVRLSCRLQEKDGDFAVSSAWSLNLQLPCEIALTRNVRRVRFRSPLLVIGHRAGRARVLGTRNGKPALLERAGSDWEEIAAAPDLVLQRGHWRDPFDSPVGDLDGDGRIDVVLLACDADDERDRLLRIRLPAE